MTLCAHKHPQTCHPNNQRMNGLMHWRSSLAPWLLQCPSPSFHHRPWGTSEMRRRYANLWGRRLARKIWVFSKVEIRYPRSLPQVPLLKDTDMQKRREFVEETDCCFTCGTIGIHLPEPVTNPLQTKWHCATTCFNYQTCYIPSVRTTLTSILLKALNHSLNNFLSNTIKHISCLHGITVRTWNPTQHQPVIPFQRVFHDTNFSESIIHSNRQRSSNPAWFRAPSAGCVWSAPPVAAAPWHAVAPKRPIGAAARDAARRCPRRGQPRHGSKKRPDFGGNVWSLEERKRNTIKITKWIGKFIS